MKLKNLKPVVSVRLTADWMKSALNCVSRQQGALGEERGLLAAGASVTQR